MNIKPTGYRAQFDNAVGQFTPQKTDKNTRSTVSEIGIHRIQNADLHEVKTLSLERRAITIYKENTLVFITRSLKRLFLMFTSKKDSTHKASNEPRFGFEYCVIGHDWIGRRIYSAKHDVEYESKLNRCNDLLDELKKPDHSDNLISELVSLMTQNSRLFDKPIQALLKEENYVPLLQILAELEPDNKKRFFGCLPINKKSIELIQKAYRQGLQNPEEIHISETEMIAICDKWADVITDKQGGRLDTTKNKIIEAVIGPIIEEADTQTLLDAAFETRTGHLVHLMTQGNESDIKNRLTTNQRIYRQYIFSDNFLDDQIRFIKTLTPNQRDIILSNDNMNQLSNTMFFKNRPVDEIVTLLGGIESKNGDEWADWIKERIESTAWFAYFKDRDQSRYSAYTASDTKTKPNFANKEERLPDKYFEHYDNQIERLLHMMPKEQQTGFISRLNSIVEKANVDTSKTVSSTDYKNLQKRATDTLLRLTILRHTIKNNTPLKTERLKNIPLKVLIDCFSYGGVYMNLADEDGNINENKRQYIDILTDHHNTVVDEMTKWYRDNGFQEKGRYGRPAWVRKDARSQDPGTVIFRKIKSIKYPSGRETFAEAYLNIYKEDK
ncbi:hypothetical protein N9N03_00450 [Chlamydiia bacterium]|nr:hypothetical protein [Chlamydiia bacterium]